MADNKTSAEERLRDQALSSEALDSETVRLVDEMILSETGENADDPSDEDADSQTEQETAADEDDAAIAKVRGEAANYRRKLRDAEAERDKLRSSVETMQRHEAERLASADRVGALSDGADLWRGGVELSELIGDEGVIDAEKVQAARDRVIADHPHWRRHHQPGAFDEGARQSVPAPGPDFASKLRDAAGG